MTSRIVIVDDVATNTLILEMMMQGLADAETTVFNDSSAALDWCADNEPDLVLLDYCMPGLDGVGFLRAFRRLPRYENIPVVMVTGQDDRASLYRALDAGASDFLTKPIDRVELLARSRNMLRLRALTNDLYRLATTDELTGLANRRHFFDRFSHAHTQALRSGQPLGLATFDIDHFKQVNDAHGHGVGDAILRAVAQCCRATLREADFIGRLGGEEFAVLMPGTDIAAAHVAGERLRAAVEAMETPVEEGVALRVTCSIGAAVLGDRNESVHALLKRADTALYAAKHSGRNRIMMAE